MTGSQQSQLSNQGSLTPQVMLLTTTRHFRAAGTKSSLHEWQQWVVFGIKAEGSLERSHGKEWGMGWALVSGFVVGASACISTPARCLVVVHGSRPQGQVWVKGCLFQRLWITLQLCLAEINAGAFGEELVRGELVSEELIGIPWAFSWHQPEHCSSPVDYH